MGIVCWGRSRWWARREQNASTTFAFWHERCIAEGAGALFRVSTLDLANLPRTPQGKIDFAQDFFGREA
jgi:hypothetical protein